MRRITLSWTLLFAGAFLVVMALVVWISRQSLWWIGWYVALSFATFLTFGWDKWAAQRGAQRTPEKTLLTLSLLGGWPGAVAAQQAFRHKTQKQPFKTQLWIALALNIIAFVLILTPAGRRALQSLLGM